MNLRYGQTWTVLRKPGKDRAGDATGSDTSHTIENCAFWWDSVTEITDRRETAIVLGNLGVPRGSDILGTDHLVAPNGNRFNAVGDPEWDQLHPMNGYDFRYMVVKLRAVKT